MHLRLPTEVALNVIMRYSCAPLGDVAKSLPRYVVWPSHRLTKESLERHA
jgi:hypothetical protein